MNRDALRGLRAAALPILLVVLGACEKSPTIRDEPVPGVLTLSVETPYADDRGLLLEVSGPGPISQVEAVGAGRRAYSRPSGASTRAAVFGPVQDGALLRFSVPDVRRVESYTARLLEATDASSALRTELSGYALRVLR